MADCLCAGAGAPRDVIDLFTPLYQACGGRLYRLHVTTDAAAVAMGDGGTVETRLNSLERALLSNTTTYFADDIAGRGKVGPLTAGDRCYVFDASEDPTVPSGAAMYIWLPSRSWHKLYNGDSPVEAQNLIAAGGGLQAIGNKLAVKVAELIAGPGLVATAANKIQLEPNAIAKELAGAGVTASGGKLTVDPAGLSEEQKAQLARELAAKLAGAGGGLSTGSDGKLTVDFSSMPPETLRAMVLPMIKTGGGLQVDSQGRIFFDAAGMDTSVFEALMKKLRLPIWLERNTSFYVDAGHAAASDTLDEGRGMSAALPFKSIQACANHICENYNVGPHFATINVAPGEYGPVTLGDFSRSTGQISIVGNTSEARPVIKQTGAGFAVTCQGGSWALVKMDLEWERDFTGVTGSSGIYNGCLQVTGGSVNVQGCYAKMRQTGVNSSGRNRSCFCFLASSGGVITLEPHKWEALIAGVFADPDHFRRHALAAEGGEINLASSSSEEALNGVISATGSWTEFAHASAKGSIQRSVAFATAFSFSASASNTGKRYACSSGGSINTANAGAEFFPGSEAGTVEASTYSWCK